MLRVTEEKEGGNRIIPVVGEAMRMRYEKSRRSLGPVSGDLGEDVQEEDGANERDGKHEDNEGISVKSERCASKFIACA